MTSAIALVLLTTPQVVKAPQDVVSLMFKKYAMAQSYSGDVVFTQSRSNDGKTLRYSTSVQYKRPDLLAIVQTAGLNGTKVRMAADGKFVTYQPTVGDSQVFEKQGQSTMSDVYAYGSRSFFGRTPVLDILIARRAHLENVIGQWATMEFGSSNLENGNYVVKGDYREYGKAPVSGQYVLEVAKDGALVGFRQTEPIQVDARSRPIHIVSEWRVTNRFEKIDDASLFKVGRN